MLTIFKLFLEKRGKERETSICCCTYLCIHWLIFLKDVMDLFLERREGRETERERNIDVREKYW